MSLFSREEWAIATGIIDEALERPREEREAFLSAACADHPELRGRIDQMLAACEAVGEALESPLPLPTGSADDIDPAEGRRIGAYRLIRSIGRGGMGTVYLAERADDQFQKRVAVKVVRGFLALPELHRRFVYERQILASLDHPNIARLLDGGVADGAPYLVMEYVEGEPVDVFTKRHGLAVDQRLELFLQVCAAVQFAHKNLIVHRDLKPSNILVTESGEVKLLDFGIAKLLAADEHPDDQPLTQTGVRLMTPDYASPEQVRGKPITTSTDVYALGVLLYELLTGTRPFELAGKSPGEFEELICDEPPTRPSTAIQRASEPPARSRDSQRLRRTLRGDLDTIVLKALQKEPERRYASVEAFADDVRRYQNGLPVRARPESFAYASAKFIRRHRFAAGIAAMTVAFIVAGALRERGLRSRAEMEARRAEAVTEYLLSVFEASDPYAAETAGGTEVTARELLDRGVERVESDLSRDPRLQVEMLSVLGSVYANLGAYDESVSLVERSLERSRLIYGDRSPQVASAIDELGRLYRMQGRYEESERYLREALERRIALFGRNHEDVALSMDHLGYMLQERSELDEAGPLLREALAIRKRVLDPFDHRIAESLSSLALHHFWKGEYAEAEPLYREAIRVMQVSRGRDHLDVAGIQHNLAQVLHLLEKHDESETLFRQALEVRRSRFTGPHPVLSVHLNNLGRLLRDRGRVLEAEPLFREALEMDLMVFGDTHSYIAASLDNLASALQQKGQLSEAEMLMRRSLAINRTLQGDDHTHVALGMNTLGIILYDAGRYEESLEAYDESLEIYRKRLGDDHLYIALVSVNKARTLYELGALAEADELFQNAIERLERVQPQGQSRLALALVGRGKILADSGDPENGLPLIERGVTLFESQFGRSDWRTAEALTILGDCLRELGRRSEAEAVLVESETVLSNTRGTDHRLTRLATAALARLHASPRT